MSKNFAWLTKFGIGTKLLFEAESKKPSGFSHLWWLLSKGLIPEQKFLIWASEELKLPVYSLSHAYQMDLDIAWTKVKDAELWTPELLPIHTNSQCTTFGNIGWEELPYPSSHGYKRALMSTTDLGTLWVAYYILCDQLKTNSTSCGIVSIPCLYSNQKQEIPDVVLCSGLGSDGEILAHQIWHLLKYANIHVVKCGLMTGLSDVARELKDLLPKKFSYIGFSLGGYLGFEILDQYPERLDAFTAISSHPFGDAAKKKEGRLKLGQEMESIVDRAKPGENIFETFENSGSAILKSVPEQIWDMALHPQHSRKSLSSLMMVVREIDRYPLRYLIAANKALAERQNRSSLLRGIEVPCLIVAGSDDHIVPADLQREYYSQIRNAELLLIQDGGHAVHLDHSDMVTNKLIRFLLSAWGKETRQAENWAA